MTHKAHTDDFVPDWKKKTSPSESQQQQEKQKTDDDKDCLKQSCELLADETTKQMKTAITPKQSLLKLCANCC